MSSRETSFSGSYSFTRGYRLELQGTSKAEKMNYGSMFSLHNVIRQKGWKQRDQPPALEPQRPALILPEEQSWLHVSPLQQIQLHSGRNVVLPSPSFNTKTLQWKALMLGKEVLAQRVQDTTSGTESSQHFRYRLIKVLDLKTVISRRRNIKHQDVLVDGIVSRKQVEAIVAKI